MATIPGNENANRMDLKVRLKYSRSENDDWTKIEDKALRKKIQNRLAKRKSRVNGKKTSGLLHKSPSLEESSDLLETSEKATTTDESGAASKETCMKPFFTSALPRDEIDNTIQSIFANPGLAEHRYINLIEYSVLRAFIQNGNLLAIGPETFADDDALSPWTVSNPYPALTPHDLCPTPLQLSTPHHPYLDMIAPPSLRDNIILTVMTGEQEDRLCRDMHWGSFTIWGSQPWNAFAWEVSQAFVTNWAWLVDYEVIHRSNFWRAERGEAPLVVPDLSGGFIQETI